MSPAGRSPPSGVMTASTERTGSPDRNHSPTRLMEGMHRVVVRPAFTKDDELKTVDIRGEIVHVDGKLREVKWLEVKGTRDVPGRIQSVEPWYKGKVKIEAGGGEFRNPGSGVLRNAETCRALQSAGLQIGMETRISYPAGPPQRIHIKGNTIIQHLCCGIYVLVIGQQWNATAVWRHTAEDRCICLCKIMDQETDEEVKVWCVARANTACMRDDRLQRCLQMTAHFDSEGRLIMPNKTNESWKEWDGRKWVPNPSVKSRASTHGWGLNDREYNRVAHTNRMQHKPKKFPARPIS